MTGKFGNTSYFTSVSNLLEEGSVKFLDGYRRTSGRVNVDQQMGENWNMFVSSFYSRNTTFGPGEWFRLTRVPAGIVLAILYWTAISVFGAIGAGGLMAPALAAWAPNIIFGCAAMYLLLTVRT